VKRFDKREDNNYTGYMSITTPRFITPEVFERDYSVSI
jgi:hypothetical protein